LLFWLLRFPFHTYQPFLHAAEQRDPLLIGFLFFALNLLAAPCSRLAPYLSRRVGERTMFWLMPLSLAISLVLMAGQLNAFGIALFFAHQVPFGLHWALVQSFVNHRIQDASRATVLSVLSFAGRLCFALTFPFVMGLGNVTDGYRWAGIGGCIATAIVMVPGRRHVAGRRAEAAQ
jgi:MFS family permease